MAPLNPITNASGPKWINLSIINTTQFAEQRANDLTAVTLWFTITTLISFTGALLLLVVLLSAIQQKRHHTGTRLLIVHLMLLQLLLLGFIYPVVNIQSYLAVFDGANATIQSRPPIHCPSAMFLLIAAMHAESWASVLLAVNRFAATVFPHHYRKLVTKKALAVMIVLPWCVGLGDNAPLWFGVGLQYTPGRPYPMCTVRATGVYAIAWATVGGYVPIVLMGVIYGALLVRLRFGRNKVSNTAPRIALELVSRSSLPSSRLQSMELGKRAAARARQLVLTKMLLLSFGWYTVCFLPGPLVTAAFPALAARYYSVILWLSRTLIICGIAASPVSILEWH